MDFESLFASEIIIGVRQGDVILRHHLRQPTSAEDLDYRRQLANVRVKNREIQTSDHALGAPIKLYDKICVKVTAQNGGDPVDVPDQYRSRITRDMKLMVINEWQARLEVEREELTKN